MKLSTPASLAAVSVLLWIGVAGAARPRYGGTLRVETGATMRTLNPAAAPLDAADAAARRVLFPLIFETVVTPDSAGGLSALLAVDWNSNAEGTQWRFRLRSGVRLHDGTPLDSARIAAALRAIEPAWRINADAGSVTIDLDRPLPDLPWQLAESRYAIAFGRSGGGEPIGTGPFAIERWEPKRLRLRAHEAHWQGRAFVDAVQVEMGRPAVEQATDLELGRADIVGIAVQDAGRLSDRGLRIVESPPRELIALAFAQQGGPVPAMRQALAQAVDREAMWSALLQRHGEPAHGLLPKWLSGYQASAAMPWDRAASRSIVARLPPAQRRATLSVAGADPMLRSIAERVAVDARDVGLTIDIVAAGAAPPRTVGIELRRVGIDSTTPERAFTALARALGVQTPSDLQGLDAVVRAEQAVLAQGVVIPLVHVPDMHGAAPHVESWIGSMVRPSGAFDLGNVWIRAGAR
jgi:peptide/nickel transport system substrate-binding protein